MSDGTRTRDRRDHNPKDLVVPTPFVPCLLGFGPFELLPLVLRLVHGLVHGIKEAARHAAGSRLLVSRGGGAGSGRTGRLLSRAKRRVETPTSGARRRSCEPSWARRRLRCQVLPGGRISPASCQERGSIRSSCWIAGADWCPSQDGRSRMLLMTSGSLERRCAGTCATSRSTRAVMRA